MPKNRQSSTEVLYRTYTWHGTATHTNQPEGAYKVFTSSRTMVVWLNVDVRLYVAALTQCKLWAIDRSVFKTILTRTGMQKHADHVEFLRRFDDLRAPSDSRIQTEVEANALFCHFLTFRSIVRSMSVCLSDCPLISETTQPNFTRFYGCWLWPWP